MANSNICIGIDLGTTNSVMAWARVGTEIEPKIIEIPMLNSNGETKWHTLLPSCVYFPQKDEKVTEIVGNSPIVGEYGKMLTKASAIDRTEKAFKLQMGMDKEKKAIASKEHSATELSSIVLRHLRERVEHTYFRKINFPDHVAIAVPASFEPSRREATKEAALSAGFKKPELVEEPIAAIHDFHNRMGRNIPFDRFGFSSTPKLVLVFDLGGGTLDVSLHQVKQGEDQYDLQIDSQFGPEKNRLTSRFTEIGGNDFDKELVEFLKKKYQEKTSNQSMADEEEEELEQQFQQYAENAKIELSIQLENWKSYYGTSEKVDPESFKVNINEILSENKFFSYDLSLNEYEQCIESFLAPNLNLGSIDNYKLNKDDPKNIIDPILHVLKKGQEVTGSIPKPDIILLNGSMARLYTIQKRLEDFFGFPPVTIGNFELAVARGAAAYMAQEIRST